MSGPDGVPTSAADLAKAGSTLYKVVAFLCRKPGLTRSEFIDYYEKQHIPRILDLERQPVGYRRTYPIPHDADTAADEANFLDRSRTRSYPVEQYISRS